MFLIAFLLLANNWAISSTSEESKWSPICNQSIPELVIDSIAVKDSQTVYYFICNTITVVNPMTETIENVSEITDYFRTTDPNNTIEDPIDIAFIHLNANSKPILSLTNLENQMEFNISLENNAVLESGLISNAFLNESMDIFNINDTNVYIFSKAISNSPAIYGVPYEWNSGLKLVNSSTYVILRDNGTHITLSDLFQKPIHNLTHYTTQLNGFDITSGFIIGNKLYFIANQFRIEISLTIDEVIPLVVHKFVDKLCGFEVQTTTSFTTSLATTDETSAETDFSDITDNTTNGESGDNKESKNLLAWIVIIIGFVIIVLLVIANLFFGFLLFRKNTKKPETESKVPQKPVNPSNPFKVKESPKTSDDNKPKSQLSKVSESVVSLPLQQNSSQGLETTSSISEERPTDLRFNV